MKHPHEPLIERIAPFAIGGVQELLEFAKSQDMCDECVAVVAQDELLTYCFEHVGVDSPPEEALDWIRRVFRRIADLAAERGYRVVYEVERREADA